MVGKKRVPNQVMVRQKRMNSRRLASVDGKERVKNQVMVRQNNGITNEMGR